MIWLLCVMVGVGGGAYSAYAMEQQKSLQDIDPKLQQVLAKVNKCRQCQRAAAQYHKRVQQCKEQMGLCTDANQKRDSGWEQKLKRR